MWKLNLLALSLIATWMVTGAVAAQTPASAPPESSPTSQAPAAQPPATQPPATQAPATQTPAAQPPAAQTPAAGTLTPGAMPPVMGAKIPPQPKNEKDARLPYVIGPEDTLNILVWENAGLSGSVTVSADGMITMPLINEIKAEGLTADQLRDKLTELFRTYIKNLEPAEVMVRVIGVRSRKYMLVGEVGRPGTYPLTGPTTVFEALVNGGSFREFANTKGIYILRKKPDGTMEKKKFNYKEVSQGKHMEQNILIQNGDTIFVP